MTDAVPAATVMLARDGEHGIEVWLLRRVTGMAFAGGMSVFPGGRVDASDAEASVPTVGGDVQAVAARLGADAAAARAMLVAAARETFEETGVLLSRPPALPTGDERQAVETRQTTFAAVLAAHDVSVDLDLLHLWAHWITPESEPRRYDTHFLLAELPAGAQARADTPEAAVAGWVDVRVALSEAVSGARPILPPTQVMLRSLADFDTVSAASAAAVDRDVTAVQPVLERRDGRLVAVLPDGEALPFPEPVA